MDTLTKLEQTSVFILREAYHSFPKLCMLWSIGKDSTVLLWLARKAFFGHVPFPLIHIDTTFKIPEMIQYRDRLARDWRLDIRYATNSEALQRKETFPAGAVDRTRCCSLLKTEPLNQLLAGAQHQRFDHSIDNYVPHQDSFGFEGVIVGARADEEGSRSKERYFSPRELENVWDVGSQPPEFWNQFNTDFPPETHVRIHPLLDWTEVNVWEYIDRERIPVVSLYFDQGAGTRFRSLGCVPCTTPIQSTARTPKEIISELTTGTLGNVSERSGRAQDQQGGAGLEILRRRGYM